MTTYVSCFRHGLSNYIVVHSHNLQSLFKVSYQYLMLSTCFEGILQCRISHSFLWIKSRISTRFGKIPSAILNNAVLPSHIAYILFKRQRNVKNMWLFAVNTVADDGLAPFGAKQSL